MILEDDASRTISARGLMKASRVLTALAGVYLPFYGLTPLWLIERLGLFGVVSAAIYETDEENEELELPEAPRLKWLRAFLKRRLMFDRRMEKYLREGERWFRHEHRWRAGRRPASLPAVVAALAWRSFDFHILHYLVLRVCGFQPNAAVWDAFGAFERIMEFEDDMISLSKDLSRKTYNSIACIAPIVGDASVVEATNGVQRDLFSDLEKKCLALAARDRVRFRLSLDIYRTFVPWPDLKCTEVMSQLLAARRSGYPLFP